MPHKSRLLAVAAEICTEIVIFLGAVSLIISSQRHHHRQLICGLFLTLYVKMSSLQGFHFLKTNKKYKISHFINIKITFLNFFPHLRRQKKVVL